MSHWTYVRDTILVEPMGRSTPEREYILKSVLNHLPLVSGSERSMEVIITQPEGYNLFTSHNEFFEDVYNRKELEHQQTQYILVLNGNLRDTEFPETVRNVSKFLCRLAKRVSIEDILVKIEDGGFFGKYGHKLIISNPDVYSEMFETPSWNWDVDYTLPCYHSMYDDPKGNWCEFLMWDDYKDSGYPKKLYNKLGYED